MAELKVAVVSFGHTDVSIDWSRALAGTVVVDLFLVFARNWTAESVVELAELPPGDGLLSDSEMRRAVALPILRYLSDRVRLHVFLYRGLRFYDPANVFLSMRLAQRLRNLRPDLVHFVGNDLRQLQIGALLGRIPTVHSVHDYKGHSGERSGVAERFNRRLARRVKLIVHSRFVGDSVRGEFPRADVTVIPFGPLCVYRQFLHAGDNGRQPGYALFFGRIAPYKGLPLLLAAGEQAHRCDPSFRLVVAGQGESDTLDAAEDQTSWLEVIRRFLPNDELAALVEGCEFVVCPYSDATQSGAVMTAYAFGKPVLGCRVGGLEEAILHEQTGYLVPPGDVGALADGLLRLHREPARLQAYAKQVAAIGATGPFAWSTIAQQIIGVYRNVAGPCTS